MTATTRAQIDEFLSARRVAVIGVSRKKGEYSRMVFEELLKQGYEAIPVNLAAGEIEGIVCYKSVKDIRPVPRAAMILLPREKAEQAVRECAEAGIERVWVYRRISGEVVEQVERKGMKVISGWCPLMFLPEAGLIHRVHGGILKWVGAYPR